MKLNFWQIVGIIVLIVGIVLIVTRPTAKTDVTPQAPTTNTP